MPPFRLVAATFAAAVVVFGCAGEPPSSDIPLVDRQTFDTTVYPLLLRDCAFPDCHGRQDRFFRVFGPGRARLDPEMTGVSAPIVPEEVEAAFERARSMVFAGTNCGGSLLARKPLEVDAGGLAHVATQNLAQRNLYPSVDNPDFLVLQNWACNQQKAPAR